MQEPEDRDHNEIIDPDQEDDDNDSDYDPNNDDDDNDDDDDDNNTPPTNQPNEPYEDPGILEEDYVEQYHPQEHDNANDEDNNEDDDNDNNNDGIENEVIQDKNVPLHPPSDAAIVAENENEEETDEAMDHHPDEVTGVEPKPLPPIQIQNERTKCELNRIAWMGQQPATFAGRTRAQGREHGTTNVMTDFDRDLFHRRVAGIQLPPEYEDQLANLKHTVLTQYTLKKGLQVFGPKGTEAVFSEMKQLHDRKVCEPINEKDLSREQKSKALGYLMFLEQKRCGRIKGRGCADGRKQRVWTNKEEATSPTVSTEAVLLTSVIDAKEQREVMTVDIPGAFMQGEQDETVHMKLEGTSAKLLTKCDPIKYQP